MDYAAKARMNTGDRVLASRNDWVYGDCPLFWLLTMGIGEAVNVGYGYTELGRRDLHDGFI